MSHNICVGGVKCAQFISVLLFVPSFCCRNQELILGKVKHTYLPLHHSQHPVCIEQALPSTTSWEATCVALDVMSVSQHTLYQILVPKTTDSTDTWFGKFSSSVSHLNILNTVLQNAYMHSGHSNTEANITVNVFYKATYDAKIRLKLCTGDFTGPARSLDV